MTYEELKVELLKRGLNKSQVESAAVANVLSILLENPEFLEIHDLKEEIKSLDRKISWIKRSAEDSERRAEDFINKAKQTVSYIDKFFEALNHCSDEKEEATLKKAQLFVNSIEVNSKYDNTAKIIGLATILTNGNLNGMEELKKINPDLFDRYR